MQTGEIREDLQQHFFGIDYRGSTLSKVSLMEGAGEKVYGWTKSPSDFLVITGSPGTGKTYLCAAIVGELGKKFRSVYCFNERTFLGKIRGGMDKYTNYDYIQEIHRITDTELFILDDFGSAGHNQWREEVMMELLDITSSNRRRCIYTSNLNEKTIFEKYGERIGSRMFAKRNTIIHLSDMPDLRRTPLI